MSSARAARVERAGGAWKNTAQMHALALSLIVLATPAASDVASADSASADSAASDVASADSASADSAGAGADAGALPRPGLGKLNTGLLLVGGGIALSTASFVGGLWAAAEQTKLDDAAAAFRREPGAATARALVDVRKKVGTSEAQALRDDVNLALIASGALTMAIGWIVAAVGAAELTDDGAP